MNDPLRVMLVTSRYPPSHGEIASLLHGVAHSRTRAAFRVIAPGVASATAVADGVVTRRVRACGPRAAVVAALGAATLIEARRWRPDVVLCADSALFPAARRTGRPVVQYLFSQAAASKPRLTSYAVRHAAASIVVGAHGHTLARCAGADRQRVEIIPPGFEPGEAAIKPLADRLPSIVSVADLRDRRTGAEILVRALPLIRSRVPDATLTLVGDGHLRESLHALARANGCEDALSCVGDLQDAERRDMLAAASIFALPGHPDGPAGGEGLGIVYSEAGAQGTPVVAGRIGEALDGVVDGVTGIFVEPGEHIELSEAISGLLLDRERASRLGAGGRERAERCAWDSVAREVEGVLRAASLRAR